MRLCVLFLLLVPVGALAAPTEKDRATLPLPPPPSPRAQQVPDRPTRDRIATPVPGGRGGGNSLPSSLH